MRTHVRNRWFPLPAILFLVATKQIIVGLTAGLAKM